MTAVFRPVATLLDVEVEPLYRYGQAKRRLDDLGPDVVWVTEGERDADTLWDKGYIAVCQPDGASRPGQQVKWKDLYTQAIRALNASAIHVVADNDAPGYWTAGNIADLLDATRWVPTSGKDVTDSEGQMRQVGQFDGYTSGEAAGNSGGKKEEAPLVKQLVVAARKQYSLFVDETGKAYAIEGNGHIAIPVDGRGSAGGRSLSAKLRVFAEQRLDWIASSTSITTAIDQLAATAEAGGVRPVKLRVAHVAGNVVIDLGRTDGQVVVITPDGWSVKPSSPVLFRRSKTTKEMPLPVRPGSLDALRPLINVTDEQWPLVVGVLVAGLLGVPMPILAILGEQGTAKSTLVRFLRRLIDESPAPTRSLPQDLRQWGVTASASYVAAFDNVSTIRPWLQDAMCRASTGDGLESRLMWTDDDVHILAFKRFVILNGIELGSFRGDLGDRLVLLELLPISEDQRLDEEELNTRFDQAQPSIVGGLYDLTSQVLKVLPEIHLDRKPRMADFARVLVAVEQVTGLAAPERYAGVRTGVTDMVLESDQVGTALLWWMQEGGEQEVELTVGELRMKLMGFLRENDIALEAKWPENPRGMGDRLRRAAPALRQKGIELEGLGNKGGRGYRYRIRKVEVEEEEPS